jgi:hypothetical protein
MEQRRFKEKASAFANMSRRDAGAPRTASIDTAKTNRYISPISMPGKATSYFCNAYLFIKIRRCTFNIRL